MKLLGLNARNAKHTRCSGEHPRAPGAGQSWWRGSVGRQSAPPDRTAETVQPGAGPEDDTAGELRSLRRRRGEVTDITRQRVTR